MAARRTWTEHKVERFRELLAKGLPRDIIAERLDKTIRQITSLYAHMREGGEQLPPLAPVAVRNPTLVSVLEGREAELAELSRRGLGRNRIAEQMGVTPNTVSGFMFRRGLCANPRRHGPPPQVLKLPINLARIKLPARAVEEADIRLGEAMWRQFEEMTG